MVRIESGRSGRVLVRFSGFERLVHWMTATCFIILGISGLNITFGKPLLLPLIGPEAFTTWSLWAKYAHNYLSFPFTLGVVLIFLMWIAWNFPTRVDVNWLREGGGIVGHKHPAADRFNAGQKMVYWIVVLGGGAVAASGYVLMFPFYGTNVAEMQLAEIVHGVVAVLFVAAMLGHIYIGTLGMEGAFEAMWDGTVDVNWAKEHHSIWLEKEASRGNLTVPPSARHDAGRGVAAIPPPERGRSATPDLSGGAGWGSSCGRSSKSTRRECDPHPRCGIRRPRCYNTACASLASPAGAARAKPPSSPKSFRVSSRAD